MLNLTPEQKAEVQQIYDLTSNSFEEFVKFFLSHHLACEMAEFHKEIYSLLPKVSRLALATPRGHAKSYICSIFYPLWLSLFEKRKNITIISASETLAVDWIRAIKRELESNQKIIAFFGNMESSKWSESHIILNNKSKCQIRGKGSGGQIKGYRPDVIICDDIETPEEVESEEQRKKLKDWLFKACFPALTPDGQFIVVGTIDHPLCVLNDLLSMDNGWEKRKYQAYKDGKQEAGYELWAANWSHERLQSRKKDIGTWAFASQYMNDPVSDETAPIKSNMIRYWRELPQQYSCVIAVDFAYSEDERADYKVASLIATDQNMNRYLVSYIRTHAPSGEFFNAVINLWLNNRDKCTALGLPNSGTEKSAFESFTKACEARRLYPPIMEVKNNFMTSTGVNARNKKQRIITTLQPLFEAGKYYIHAEHIEARDELLTIGSSRWDDVVDTMAYAEQLVQPVVFDNTPENEGYAHIMGHNSNYGMDY